MVSPDRRVSTSSLGVSGIASPTSYPSSLILCNMSTTLANVSRPAAPPAFAVLGGYMYRSMATFLSALDVWRSIAHITAISATRSSLSSIATYTREPSSSFSVEHDGTEIICPSNSGWATSKATSAGDRPLMSAFHVS